MELVAPAGPVYQAGTLSGNPLAMTAGIETLRALREPGVWDELERAAERLVDGLAGAAREAGVPVQLARAGSMFGLFFADRPVRELGGREACGHASASPRFHGRCSSAASTSPPRSSRRASCRPRTATRSSRRRSPRHARRSGRSPDLYAFRPVKVLLVTMYFPPAGGRGGAAAAEARAVPARARGRDARARARRPEVGAPGLGAPRPDSGLGPPRPLPRPAGEEARGGAPGRGRARARARPGERHLAAAARPRRERELEPHRDPRGDPDRPARGDRRGRHDVSAGVGPPRGRGGAEGHWRSLGRRSA